MNCISQEASMRAKQCLCFNKSRLLGKDLEPVKCNLPHPLGCCPFQGGGFVVIVIVAPIVCGIFVFGPCFAVQFKFTIILLRKRELFLLL